MSTLIDDLLNLSRVSRAAVHLQTVDPSAEVEDIAEQLQRQEPGQDVNSASSASTRSEQIPISSVPSCIIW